MCLKKLEKAYFYNSSQRDIIADIFWLTEKLYKSRNTILICCKDYENVKIIGDFLWAYRDDGFIPHSLEKENQVSVYPILITSKIDKDYKHNTLLALNGILVEEKDCQKFSNVYYFFDSQENKEKENARIMWKNFVSQNVVCKYWVNKANKWVLQNSS